MRVARFESMISAVVVGQSAASNHRMRVGPKARQPNPPTSRNIPENKAPMPVPVFWENHTRGEKGRAMRRRNRMIVVPSITEAAPGRWQPQQLREDIQTPLLVILSE